MFPFRSTINIILCSSHLSTLFENFFPQTRTGSKSYGLSPRRSCPARSWARPESAGCAARFHGGEAPAVQSAALYQVQSRSPSRWFAESPCGSVFGAQQAADALYQYHYTAAVASDDAMDFPCSSFIDTFRGAVSLPKRLVMCQALTAMSLICIPSGEMKCRLLHGQYRYHHQPAPFSRHTEQ